MPERQYRLPNGGCYFVDTAGFVWREFPADADSPFAGFVSMAWVNPDNGPIPGPRSYLIPEDEIPFHLLVPWWRRLSWWLRPYWHATDTRVWRWRRTPCRILMLPPDGQGPHG